MQNQTTTNQNATNNSEPLRPLFVAVILDKSGSMRTIARATVDGFNEYLTTARHETPDALMSLTLFDTKLINVHVAEPIGTIPLLTAERYARGGMGNTALNDAIGATVVAIENGAFAKDRRVLVVVTTDGLENSSIEWTRAQVSQLVKRKEADGWKFVFFGANIDAAEEASSMSIPAHRTARYQHDDAGTKELYRKITMMHTSFGKGDAEETWTAEIHKS